MYTSWCGQSKQRNDKFWSFLSPCTTHVDVPALCLLPLSQGSHPELGVTLHTPKYSRQTSMTYWPYVTTHSSGPSSPASVGPLHLRPPPPSSALSSTGSLSMAFQAGSPHPHRTPHSLDHHVGLFLCSCWSLSWRGQTRVSGPSPEPRELGYLSNVALCAKEFFPCQLLHPLHTSVLSPAWGCP